MMRKDLVEKYDFDWENVKTVEDMYPFWDAIRDNEPDLYPVGDLSIQAFEDDFVAMCMIQDYYTVAGSGASSFYIKKGDDSYTVDWFPDVVREYRAKFGELYDKGLYPQRHHHHAGRQRRYHCGQIRVPSRHHQARRRSGAEAACRRLRLCAGCSDGAVCQRAVFPRRDECGFQQQQEPRGGHPHDRCHEQRQGRFQYAELRHRGASTTPWRMVL